MLTKKYKGVSGLVGVFIGIMVAIIVAVSVAIPTIATTIDSISWTNYTTAKTLIALSPLLIAVVIVLAIVGVMKLG